MNSQFLPNLQLFKYLNSLHYFTKYPRFFVWGRDRIIRLISWFKLIYSAIYTTRSSKTPFTVGNFKTKCVSHTQTELGLETSHSNKSLMKQVDLIILDKSAPQNKPVSALTAVSSGMCLDKGQGSTWVMCSPHVRGVAGLKSSGNI